METKMLALGQFVFEQKNLPYQEFQQQLAWRHPAGSRVGQRPAHQFTGPEDEKITLTGVLIPELTGGESAIEQISVMGDEGLSWPLITGMGDILGMFVVESLSTTRSVFFQDGTARRIEYTLNILRVDDDDTAAEEDEMEFDQRMEAA